MYIYIYKILFLLLQPKSCHCSIKKKPGPVEIFIFSQANCDIVNVTVYNKRM